MPTGFLDLPEEIRGRVYTMACSFPQAEWSYYLVRNGVFGMATVKKIKDDYEFCHSEYSHPSGIPNGVYDSYPDDSEDSEGDDRLAFSKAAEYGEEQNLRGVLDFDLEAGRQASSGVVEASRKRARYGKCGILLLKLTLAE